MDELWKVVQQMLEQPNATFAVLMFMLLKIAAEREAFVCYVKKASGLSVSKLKEMNPVIIFFSSRSFVTLPCSPVSSSHVATVASRPSAHCLVAERLPSRADL